MSLTTSIDREVRSEITIEPAFRTSTLVLTWALAVVLVGATAYGLLADGYRETPTRELLGAILRGQDLLTLLTVPVLVGATMLARRGSLRAHLVSLGVLLYIPYTYLMYVVVPYNDAFLLYVAAIGLGSYLFLDGLLRTDVEAVQPTFADAPRRGIGWFFIVVGSLFAAAWLAQNLTVIPGGIPEGLFVYDVPSTVHVLDLAFILPAVIATGVLLLRRHPAGVVLAVALLVKMVTLGLALLFMNGGVAVEGGTVNLAETVTWVTIVVVSTSLVVALFRRMQPPPQRWLKPSLWTRLSDV
jgi:hypothetical protein